MIQFCEASHVIIVCPKFFKFMQMRQPGKARDFVMTDIQNSNLCLQVLILLLWDFRIWKNTFLERPESSWIVLLPRYNSSSSDNSSRPLILWIILFCSARILRFLRASSPQILLIPFLLKKSCSKAIFPSKFSRIYKPLHYRHECRLLESDWSLAPKPLNKPNVEDPRF